MKEIGLYFRGGYFYLTLIGLTALWAIVLAWRVDVIFLSPAFCSLVAFGVLTKEIKDGVFRMK